MTPTPEKDSEISIRKVIPAKRWKVLRLMMRAGDYARFMPNVKEASVLEKSVRGSTVAWSIVVDKIPLSWKEKNEFDLKQGTVRFYSVEGDLEKLEGEWKVTKVPEGTEIVVSVRFRIGLPLVANLIGKTFEHKVWKNFSSMLDAIEERLAMGRYKNIQHRKHSDLHGFAVIGHPYNFQHLLRYFKHFKPDIKLPSKEFLAQIFDMTPAYKSFDIKKFRSKTGKEVRGYFIMCPIIPDMLMLSPDRVVQKVHQACKVAEGLGVGIVTLGGFTSIAGERFGKSLASGVNVPVTTGNTYTVAMTLEGIYRAVKMMGINLSEAKATVIGGNGDIGGTVARILAGEIKELIITGRSEKNLMEMERVLSYAGKAKIVTSTDNNQAIRGADIVLAAASTSNSIIDFNNFKSGAVICDVGYPKNISYTECKRDDILIFSGGIVSIPDEFDLGFDVGMPSSKVLYGCFAEAIILDLEERYENFSWGRGNITKEKVSYLLEIGLKHGFELAPFFWGNRMLTDEDIKLICEKAKSVPKS